MTAWAVAKDAKVFRLWFSRFVHCGKLHLGCARSLHGYGEVRYYAKDAEHWDGIPRLGMKNGQVPFEVHDVLSSAFFCCDMTGLRLRANALSMERKLDGGGLV